MNPELRNKIDSSLPGLLRQASATISVNRMVGVNGERVILPLEGRDIEMVYYRAASENAPLIVGYHSGGWLFGGCALNDIMWTAMSEALGVNIASIGYRKAPKFKWRESLADAYDSAMYLYDHSKEYGFDKSRVSLLGPSAGGNMAAAVCIKALRENRMVFDKLFLLYPLLDVSTEPELKGAEYYGGPSAYIMNEQHISAEESTDPLASPVFAGPDDLKGFPDTYCYAAGHDVLNHEDKIFADKVTDAGGKGICIIEPEMSHCYFELGFRDRLTDFEKDFIGPDGVRSFDSGATKAATYRTLDNIKKVFENDKR